jgi:Cys-tRNA(Pro)/Cys-tRNA(Cys) deacylase
MRALEARGIAYTAKEYDPSREFHSAAEAAALLGTEPAAVYKTLVVIRDTPEKSKPMLVVAPSTHEIDLKRLAKQIGEKRLRMATQREAERLTGLQVGGISALALTAHPFDVYLDRSASSQERIHVSAGVRGIDLEIAPADFIAVTGARYADDITDPGSTSQQRADSRL